MARSMVKHVKEFSVPEDGEEIIIWIRSAKESVTFLLDQDSRPAGCARNVSVSLMNSLLNNSN